MCAQQSDESPICTMRRSQPLRFCQRHTCDSTRWKFPPITSLIDSSTRSIARVEYDGRSCEARKAPPTVWLNLRRFINRSADVNGVEVLRHDHDALRRRRLHVGDERLEPLDRRRLTHVVRHVE